MVKQTLALAALTLLGSTSFASVLECKVTEVIAGQHYSQTVVVENDAAEFLTLTSKSTKGLVAYAGGYAVINLYDVNENIPSYVTTPINDESVVLVFAPEYDQNQVTHVSCQVK